MTNLIAFPVPETLYHSLKTQLKECEDRITSLHHLCLEENSDKYQSALKEKNRILKQMYELDN
jgi:hypothetical protein